MEKDKTPDSQVQKDNSRNRTDDFKMHPHDYQTLRDQIADVKRSDPPLGRTLENIVLHLGHLHGFDPDVEDAKARARDLKEQREYEDARVKEESEQLKERRAYEDATLTTPEQKKYAALTRAQEDKQIEEKNKARSEKRAQEDAQLREAQKGDIHAV
jgi:hypothetical protein